MWHQLAFEVLEDDEYQYTYTGSQNTFTIRASADFECDGTVEAFTIRGSVEHGVVTLTDSSSD